MASRFSVMQAVQSLTLQVMLLSVPRGPATALPQSVIDRSYKQELGSIGRKKGRAIIKRSIVHTLLQEKAKRKGSWSHNRKEKFRVISMSF